PVIERFLYRGLATATVCTVHDARAHERRPWLGSFSGFYGGFDRLICHSQSTRQKVMASLPGARIDVVPHGVYSPLASPLPDAAAARGQLHLPSGSRVALFFGFIRRYKGLDLFLEAIRAARTEGHDLIGLVARRAPTTPGRRSPPRPKPRTGRPSQSVARLRILYIGPHQPSPIAVRPWLFLGALQERHAIDILTLATSHPGDGTPSLGHRARAYRPTGLDRLAALRHLVDRAYPLQAIAVESRPMRRAVHAAIADGEYDVIHVEHLRAFQFVPQADRRRILFDAVDCVSDLFAQAAPYQAMARRRIFQQEARRVAGFEAMACSSAAR